MTGNKINTLAGAQAHLTGIVGHAGCSDPMRASFRHAVIGAGGTSSQIGKQLARVHIDIWMMVAFDEKKFVTAAGKAGDIILLSDFHSNRPAVHDSDLTAWIEYKPVWTACTKITKDFVEARQSAPLSPFGEPVTLKLLFDAIDNDTATRIAQIFHAIIEEWNDQSAPLRDAMAVISRMLLDVSAYPRKPSEVFHYRAAKVCKGWVSHNFDNAYRQAFEAARSDSGGIAKATSDFWLRQVEASWQAAGCLLEPIRTGALERPQEVAESEDDGGATDDYFSGERLMALYFGNKRRLAAQIARRSATYSTNPRSAFWLRLDASRHELTETVCTMDDSSPFDTKALEELYTAISSSDGVTAAELRARVEAFSTRPIRRHDIQAYREGRTPWKKLRDEVVPIERFLSIYYPDQARVRFPLNDQPPDAWLTVEVGSEPVGIEVTGALARAGIEIGKSLADGSLVPGFIALQDDAPSAEFAKVRKKGRILHARQQIDRLLDGGIAGRLAAKNHSKFAGHILLISAPIGSSPNRSAAELKAALGGEVERLPFSQIFIIDRVRYSRIVQLK